MPAKPAKVNESVRREVLGLLQAETDYTRAYHAWKVAPENRRDLESAARRLDQAEQRVAKAQTRDQST